MSYLVRNIISLPLLLSTNYYPCCPRQIWKRIITDRLPVTVHVQGAQIRSILSSRDIFTRRFNFSGRFICSTKERSVAGILIQILPTTPSGRWFIDWAIRGERVTFCLPITVVSYHLTIPPPPLQVGLGNGYHYVRASFFTTF